jgi:hypothetical protein
MTPRRLIPILCLLAAGCAQLEKDGEQSPYAVRMKEAGDVYLACISREAEKDMKNPTGAEDIATAAHGRCWTEWENYGAATRANFGRDAGTREEIQFAEDRTEGHLRQFEREARRGVVDAVVSRSLKSTSKP